MMTKVIVFPVLKSRLFPLGGSPKLVLATPYTPLMHVLCVCTSLLLKIVLSIV